MLDYLYITRSRAKESGLTHEGTLFGVPAWFAGDGDEVVAATPKIPVLHLWCMLADACFALFAYITPADKVLVSPISVSKRI